jgi:hypothetical protein
MNTQQLHALLGRLSGHLITTAPAQGNEILRLHQSLSRSLLPEDIQQLKSSDFVFENSDLFAAERIPSERSAALRFIAEKKTAEAAEPELRVFVREVPVRSPQLRASVAPWAGGAGLDHTIGPFTNKDGRQFWFDFFRIEKQVALCIQGSPDPVLLFTVRTRFVFPDLNLPPVTDLLPIYQLPASSIWINARILANNAPSGTFTGLTVKGGTITLSAPPQLINGKLTISPNTRVDVSLQLKQPAVQGADPSGPYGIDARKAVLHLPQEFNFHFSAQGSSIDVATVADWKVYGQKTSFEWNRNAQPVYDNLLQRILIPFTCAPSGFQAGDCQSPFCHLRGKAPVTSSAWGLSVAAIDVLHPTPASGIGGMLAKCASGLTAVWTGVTGGVLNLAQPCLLAEPGTISITDVGAGNVFCQQTFQLWKDNMNPFGSTIQVQFPSATGFFYESMASGFEALMTLANADVQIDRPVTVSGQPVAIRSNRSVLILAVGKAMRLVYLFDDNILAENAGLNQNPPVLPRPIALALENALFKVTPVNGCLLFGQLDNDFVKVKNGSLFLAFGLFVYLPTLPDPYAADLGFLKFQFRGKRDVPSASLQFGGQSIWRWLVCEVRWHPAAGGNDKVIVSFFFAPLQNQFRLLQASTSNASQADAAGAVLAADVGGSVCVILLNPIKDKNPPDAAAGAAVEQPNTPAGAFSTESATGSQGLPDYQAEWDKQTRCLQQDLFALLDVSTNADLLGVSFNVFGSERLAMVATFGVAPNTAAFPLQVRGMDVVSSGNNVRAFTVPEISWEPVLNTAPGVLPGDPPGVPANTQGVVPNYYPDDGGPTHIYNNSVNLVPLAPIPVSKFIVEEFKKQQLSIVSSLFTLPFGMRALATLTRFIYPQKPPSIEFNQPAFDNNLKGGLQLQFNAGKLPTDDYAMFTGATAQINNVLDLFGNPTGASTLGQSVTTIFNDEFRLKPNPLTSRGVPMTRIDFSGYGASIFSNWFNPLAQMAQTSQAKFDVWVGRTAHEVIQVKSIIYPWGIRVVRTIILYRASTGYEYRVDTGWKAESDGKFDFSYYVKYPSNNPNIVGLFPDYQVHPGVIQGLFNIKNIVEANNQFKTTSIIHTGEYYLDDNGFTILNSGPDMTTDALLQMVFFDTDVEIEGVVQGQVNGRVPSKRVMGFVQLAPRGIPLSKEAYQALLNYQPDPIGGAIDCIIDVGQTGQRMRLNRFDVSNSFGANGTDIVFAASARGSVILPKDGSWSMVQHRRGTGEVTHLPQQLPVPIIRIGALTYQVVQINPTTQTVNLVQPDIAQSLLRIANPADLLRAPVNDTLNYGYLHSTETQKALFLTPAYKLMAGAPPNAIPMLMSKTPPLFVDAFRIVNSKAIFPNIGDAESNLGDAISLFSNGTEFLQDTLTDGGKNVLQLMQINKVVNNTVQEGYKLLKQVQDFSLPNSSWTLIEVGGAFKIYIEYKASNIQKQGGGTKNLPGSLNFDVDSFANNVADRWKSIMNDVALVVDLGPIQRLMTIKGNWNAKNGAETQYGGDSSDPDFPSPQIEFAPELKPVIEILQILQDLQTENYKDAFQSGLKLAMSNKDDSWEYKLEASKEIPVVRFPTPDILYNDPNAPFKLEAGLKLGAYFNAALKITTDPKQLLPSAGGYLGFYGRLSVMCVSISIATVYAVGQVNLDIGADTKLGPNLRMKFGFGAQLVVGLPVVGNVSVLYMVGVEIYIDSSTLKVSAFLLFQGQAELLGGIIGVTIMIEAKGTVSRANDRTDLAAQVTFGLDISIFLVIDISFSTSWEEQRQIA